MHIIGKRYDVCTRELRWAKRKSMIRTQAQSGGRNSL